MIGNIPNPLQAFQWSDNGQAMTPEQVERRRAMAALLQRESSSMAPVAHWTQAAARGLGGFLAGRSERIATRAENEGLASADEYVANNPILSALMGETGQALGMPQPVQAAPQPVPQATNSLQPGDLNFPASLIQSESGGNWSALNNEGYGGRLQFGAARLADAANAGVIPAGIDGAAFSRLPPEQQQAVERWHFADIDRQAKARGLDQYIGQNIGGTTITQDGIRAMAHLGGIGGAAQFLQSGGQHNPADSNGTSLARYAAMHGGGGGVSTNAAGMIQAPAQAPSGVVAALAGAQGNPWVAQKYGPVLEALMGQEMGRQDAAYQQSLAQSDPMYQAQLQAQQLANQQAMMPQPVDPWAGVQEINGQLVQMGPNGPQVIGDYRTADPGFTTLPPQEAQAMGLDPSKVYQRGADGRITEVGGGGVNVTNIMPGQNKFDEAFASGDAATLNTMTEAGMAAQRNLPRIDELEQLLAASPSGMEAILKQRAGEWGINTNGLDTIQAAQAIINSLVPEQRQPGSGPMSDADLELFKQSLPRLINQPGGNASIVAAMRAIAQYDAEGAAITQSVRDGSMTRAEGFAALQNRVNPLADFRAPQGTGTFGDATTPSQINSQAEYDALPSGTRFIAPDGTVRSKP